MIYIGVLFHDNEELVDPFFFFLRKSMRDTEHKVIALNNGSADDTAGKLLFCLRDEDTYIHKAENVGISKARNEIIQAMRYDAGTLDGHFLALLDSDVFVARAGSISLMMSELEKDKSNGAAYGFTHSFNDWNTHDPGVCFSVTRAEMFERVGLFDERFFCYYDDTDFYMRLKDAGYQIINCSNARAVHAWGSTLWYGKQTAAKTKEILLSDNEKFNAKWGTNLKIVC